MRLLQEDLGQRAHFLPFAHVDCLVPATVPGPAAGLHLADHQGLPPGKNEIEFADPAAPVARHNPVAAGDIPSFGGALTPAPDTRSLIHIRQASVEV